MAVWEGGFSGRPVSLRLTVSQGAQSVEGNYSNVSWTLEAVKTGNTTAWNNYPAYWSVNINGAVWSGSWTYNFNGAIGQVLHIAGASTTYSHNADGTLTLSTYADASDPNGYLGFASTGGSMGLTTIPRATIGVWAVPGNAIAGVAKTLNLPRSSASFTHTVQYKVGSSGWTQVGTGLGTSVNITVPLTMLSQIPNSTTGSGVIRVTTYNGATLIGTQDSSFILEAPSTVVPDFTTITASEATAGLAANVGGFVQGLSKLALAITGAAGIYGSTITSYKITVAGQTVNAQSGTTPAAITSSGTVTISGTVTDSRGRTKTKTVNVTVLPYAPPNVTSVSVQRSLVDGTPNDNGTYLRVNVNASVQSLVVTTQRNTMFIKTYTRVRGTAPWTLKETYTVPSSAVTFNSYRTVGTFSIETPYDVLVEVTDEFATSATQYLIPTAAIFMHWDGVDGVGIGKYRTQGQLDVLGQIYQNDGRTVLDVLSVASETVKGPLEIATTAEVQALTDDTRTITPAKLRAGVVAVGGPVPVIPSSVNVGTGGTATISSTGKVTFSGSNDGVTLNGIFSSGVRQYQIRLSVTATTGSDWWYFRFAAGGTETSTAAYYYQSLYGQTGTTAVLDNVAAGAFTRIGHVFTGTTASSFFVLDVEGPNSNLRGVGVNWQSMYSAGGVVTWVHGASMWNGAGTFDGIWIYPGGGQTVGGEVEVIAYA